MSTVTARARYWPVQLIRAIPALAVGFVITFSADHSSTFGLIVFGAFALSTGIIVAWGAFRSVNRLAPLVRAVISVLSGIAALVFNSTGLGTLFLIVISFAAITGFLELYQGLRARGRDPFARDWITVGALTSVLAIAVLLVPPDFAAPWSVVDATGAATGTVTAQIIVVGIIGAYTILIGVYLVIGGFSARWATLDETVSATPVTGQ